MKCRNGFVSNSSSSSFVISREKLTPLQCACIEDYAAAGKMLHLWTDDELEHNRWHISFDDCVVRGSTFMDNIPIGSLLEAIGVDDKDIEWRD